MTSLTSQLLSKSAAASLGDPAAEDSIPVVEQSADLVVKSAGEREALAAADVATKIAAQLEGQMVKVASSGGRLPDGAGELMETLQKLAHYVPELVRVAQARQRYADFCLDQAADGAHRQEAYKLASEMHADGFIEVPEGGSFEDLVDDIGDEDLRVVKLAHDLVASGRLTRFGEVDETQKTAHEGSAPIGDSDDEFLRRHAWLLSK